MYIVFLVSFLQLAASLVAANSNTSYSFASSLALRQTSSSSSATDPCNATCMPFYEMNANCDTPQCHCTVLYFQALGDCLLCGSNTTQKEANVQFLLNVEMAQCHKENIKINFPLDLPPAVAATVENFNRDSATLRRTQTAYLALQIAGGHIGLVVVLAYSIFSNRIHRDPTYINFCITWIISSVAFSLSLYRGTTGNDIINSLVKVLPKMCVTQAALTEGAQVMTAASTLALIIQLWLNLRIAIHGDSYGPKRARWTTGMLLVTPYILFLVFGLSAGFVGSKYTLFDGTSQSALPARFYCIVYGPNSFLQVIYGITVTLLTLTLIFDALIINILYRNWRAFREVKTKTAVSLSVLLRFIGFSIYRVVVAIAYVSVLRRIPVIDNIPDLKAFPMSLFLSLLSMIPPWVDMLQATIPGVAVLILGINRDMIHSMMFWRWFGVKH